MACFRLTGRLARPFVTHLLHARNQTPVRWLNITWIATIPACQEWLGVYKCWKAARDPAVLAVTPIEITLSRHHEYRPITKAELPQCCTCHAQKMHIVRMYGPFCTAKHHRTFPNLRPRVQIYGSIRAAEVWKSFLSLCGPLELTFHDAKDPGSHV